MNDRKRFDVALSEQNNISREKAKMLIQSGKALINGKAALKPSYLVSCEDKLIITEKMKYVSRGGFKLEKGLQYFNIDLTGKTCVDVGAATGGFTDCMLQHGAKRVCAVDVGHSQLADELRQDARVVSYEKTNVKNAPVCLVDEKADFAAVDVSFISLCKIFNSVRQLFTNEAIFLVKPQFEAGRNARLKNAEVHRAVLRKVTERADLEGLNVEGLTASPIKGGDGNIEYLLYINKTKNKLNFKNGVNIAEVVKEAFGKVENN